MSKIINIGRFKSDQDLSFNQWKFQFEASLSVQYDLKTHILCWAESSTFTFISQTAPNQKDRVCEDLVKLIDEKFIGGYYRDYKSYINWYLKTIRSKWIEAYHN